MGNQKMSSESENEKIQSYEREIKQLKEQLKEAKLKEKPVTQNIANQHIIQGNNINNSNLNANVNHHGNSLKSVQVNENFENDHQVENLESDDTDSEAELSAKDALVKNLFGTTFLTLKDYSEGKYEKGIKRSASMLNYSLH